MDPAPWWAPIATPIVTLLIGLVSGVAIEYVRARSARSLEANRLAAENERLEQLRAQQVQDRDETDKRDSLRKAQAALSRLGKVTSAAHGYRLTMLADGAKIKPLPHSNRVSQEFQVALIELMAAASMLHLDFGRQRLHEFMEAANAVMDAPTVDKARRAFDNANTAMNFALEELGMQLRGEPPSPDRATSTNA